MQTGAMMMTYEVYTTVNEDKNIVVSRVPFGIGQRVKVILMADKGESTQRVQTLNGLFKRTQALPQAQKITEDEIATEIAAYRSTLP
jgi:hypothetical protein